MPARDREVIARARTARAYRFRAITAGRAGYSRWPEEFAPRTARAYRFRAITAGRAGYSA